MRKTKKDDFEKQCIRDLMETILVIKQGIELIDKNRPANAGALLGSQAFHITEFLRKNNNNPLVKECARELEKQGKEIKKLAIKKITENFQHTIDIMKKKGKEDTRYIG